MLTISEQYLTISKLIVTTYSISLQININAFVVHYKS